MNVYFNEFDRQPAAWLRQLQADGHLAEGPVDERSIADVKANDICGFGRVHFFAGIGGWELALQLAGWPDDRPVWTGSCPCQPFSAAGKRKGQTDERHLWPEMFRLIRECRPPTIFGEQVSAAIRLGWLDGVFADLESEGYACGSVVLGAHSVGSPHIRQRLYWVADARQISRGRWPNVSESRPSKTAERDKATIHNQRCGGLGGLADAGHEPAGRAAVARETQGGRSFGDVAGCGQHQRLGDHNGTGSQGRFIGRERAGERAIGATGAWSNYDLIPCRDGKARRVEPGVLPLAHGVSGRVGLIRGYGNAIVPQVAAAFIQAFLETEEKKPC